MVNIYKNMTLLLAVKSTIIQKCGMKTTSWANTAGTFGINMVYSTLIDKCDMRPSLPI